MKHISLPKKFTVNETEKGKKAEVIIEPCYPGYGLTLGNALRRVLLSSLPGGAVTAVKIEGADHEFSAISGVTEDVVDIILNLKQLNFKIHSDEPIKLKLSAKGEKKVTASDIEANSDVEVLNKNFQIATLNDKDAKLNIELTVAKGIGYVPSEEQEASEKQIGLIAVDSIFSPVLNVGLKTEETRVGKRTDYDKIILNIETDGTITPEEAVQKASEILANQFNWLIKGGREEIEQVDIEAPVIVPAETEEIKSEETKEAEPEKTKE